MNECKIANIILHTHPARPLTSMSKIGYSQKLMVWNLYNIVRINHTTLWAYLDVNGKGSHTQTHAKFHASYTQCYFQKKPAAWNSIHFSKICIFFTPMDWSRCIGCESVYAITAAYSPLDIKIHSRAQNLFMLIVQGHDAIFAENIGKKATSL